MRSEFILLIVVGALFGYFFFGYLQKSEGDADPTVFGQKASIKEDAKYHRKDSIGQPILDLTLAPQENHINIWHRSPLKQEFLSLFPNFSAMKNFAKDRIIGEDFQNRLLAEVTAAEDDYFTGKTSQREAEERLERF